MAKTANSFRWLLLGAAGAGSIALALILFLFDPSRYNFYPTCLFHQTTGLLCPACGSLRALHQLLHGHVAAAFHFNPLLVLSLPLCGWFMGVSALRRLRNQPPRELLPTKCILVFAAIALLFTVWRNLSGSPFAALPG